MAHPLVLTTGFGPFEDCERNPSREVAERLEAEPAPGLRFVSRVLPVSFERAPAEIDRFLEEWSGKEEEPALFMALGVQRDPGYRLEVRARARFLRDDRPDTDGVNAVEARLRDGPHDGPDRFTTLDLEELVRALRHRGVNDAVVSHDAGGYVCECAYFRVLERVSDRGFSALFVHVPPLRFAPLERQVEVCRWIAMEALS